MEDQRFVLRGPPLNRVVTSALNEVLLGSLKLNKDKIILVDATTNEELRGKLLLAKSIQLAKWFQSVGVESGDCITINSENRIEFVVATVATFLVGATVAPLNSDYTAAELNHGLNLSKPKIVFCSKKTTNKIVSILSKNSYIQKVVLFGNDTYSNPTVLKLNDILKGVNEIDEDFIVVPVNPRETVATILCSSGTTGLPKGVMCTYDNITTYLDVTLSTKAVTQDADPVLHTIIGLPPFFHSFGFMIMLMNTLAGAKTVVMNKFSPHFFLQTVVKFKVGRILLPPPAWLTLVKDPSIMKQYDLSCVKEIRCGAAALGKEMEDEIKQKFKVGHMSQAYGMTETTLGVLMHDMGSPIKVGSVGKVVPGMMCKVINDKGESQGPNQHGELCFKGPLIMKGYIGNPQATAETIDKDGWLRTGDIGYYDHEGYFYIVDRIKELIKYKAYQVAPAELEDLLLSHPKIKDAAVIGLPDANAGELPLAFIVKKPKVNLSKEEVKKHVADTLSYQKHLRGGVMFIDEIPKNPTGKILRRVLKEKAIGRTKTRSKL